MLKKIITLLLIIMGLGLFSGCSSGIWFKVGYEGKGYDNRFVYTDANGDDEGVYNLVRVINSFDELKVLCDESNNPAFIDESSKFSSNLSKKIREYDETFFVEKSLIIYSFTASNTGVSYNIKGLIIENEELLLDIRKKETNGTFIPIETPWVFLIEVKKVDIKSITNIKTK